MTRMYRTAGLALAVALLVIGGPAWASSHREAPAISQDPDVDNTDVYAFVSPDAPTTVTLIANFVPMEEPNGGPNFYAFSKEALYSIYIDNDGDALPDIEYQFDFSTTVLNSGTFLYNTGAITSLTDPDFNIRQSYTLTEVRGLSTTVLGTGLPCPPVNVGPASTPNYEALATAAIRSLPSGIKVFAGQRDDPFFVDLGATFDLLTIRPGPPGNMGGGLDGLDGFNCQTLALQIPISQLTRNNSVPTSAADSAAVVGVWSTASRLKTQTLNASGIHVNSGDFVQVSRLGMPLVNEVVIPLVDKDKWNASVPSADVQFLPYVTNPELAVLLNLLYGISVPPTPRNDLVAVFLTGVSGLNQPPGVTPSEQIRLNVAIPPELSPNRLGVLAGDTAGFPNGRRLADDIVDIELRAVAGVLVPGFDIAPNNQLGDGVDINDVPFLTTFPYVGTPHQGFDHTHAHAEP